MLTNALAVVNDNEFDKTANSDQNVLPADIQSEELLNSVPGDILDNIHINNPEEQDRFLSRLYHPIFEGIQIDEGFMMRIWPLDFLRFSRIPCIVN